MGERRLVALLKELPSLNFGTGLFYKHFTATRFFSDRLLKRGVNEIKNPWMGVSVAIINSIGRKEEICRSSVSSCSLQL